jgi:hypothetical protein
MWSPVSAVESVTGADGVTKALGPDFLNAWGKYPGGISLIWCLSHSWLRGPASGTLTRMYAVKDPRDLPKAGIVTAVTHTIVGFMDCCCGYGALYLVSTGLSTPSPRRQGHLCLCGLLGIYVRCWYSGRTCRGAVLASMFSRLTQRCCPRT